MIFILITVFWLLLSIEPPTFIWVLYWFGVAWEVIKIMYPFIIGFIKGILENYYDYNDDDDE